MVQSDNMGYNINFLAGINCLLASNYKQATHFFLKAIIETDPLDNHHDIHFSYLELSEVLNNYKNDILNYYHKIDLNLPIEPEVQLNLACAEFIKGDRKRAFQAIDRINDEELSPNISEDIHSFFNLVGKRKKDHDGLLKRDKFIYKSMGKLFRKKENVDASDIEAFIINTTEKRYKGAMLNQLH